MNKKTVENNDNRGDDVGILDFWGLLERLQADYPELRFCKGRKFMYRPSRTIVIPQELWKVGDLTGVNETEHKIYSAQLLHELGHAMLGHRDYQTDIERLKMECAAWEKAKELGVKYGIEIDQDLIETELDSYRDWLHQRSKCLRCGLTRYQDVEGNYHCPGCEII